MMIALILLKQPYKLVQNLFLIILIEGKINKENEFLVNAIDIDSNLANLVQEEGDQLAKTNGQQLAEQLMIKLSNKMVQNDHFIIKYLGS